MLMTQKEVSRELRVSIKTLQRMRRAGQLRFMRWGHRTIRFSSSEIEKFKESFTIAGEQHASANAVQQQS